jgi:hypothetical protein
MTGITNFITGDSADFMFGTGNWEVTDYGYITVSSTLGNTTERMAKPGCGSLKIQLLSGYGVVMADSLWTDTVTYKRWPVPVEYTGWPVRCSAFVYATGPVNAYLEFTVYRGVNDGFSLTMPEKRIEPYKWTLLSLEEKRGSVPDWQTIPFIQEGDTEAQVSMRVVFTPVIENDGFGGEFVYIGCPVFSTPLAVTDNVFTAETWSRLPQYIKDADRDQEDPDFPLLRFMDIATRVADDVFRTWDTIRYLPSDLVEFDPESDTPYAPKESGLVYAPDGEKEWYPWLANILGFKLLTSDSGFSTWSGLSQGLDQDLSGEADWSEWETVADTGDVGTDVSWEELEQLDPQQAATDALLYWQWQLQTAAFGIKGGTVASIKAAAQLALTGTKTVTATPLADGNPWLIRLTVLSGETDSLNAVIEAAMPAVPAGFNLDAEYAV